MKEVAPRLQSNTKPFILLEKLTNKTKKNFEIVVSRYDEDISWCDNYKDFITVYNKGINDLSYDYISLENKGHLADTILRHIIKNYDNLSDVTFFTHGSFNYRNDQLIKQNSNEFNCFDFNKFITTDKNTLVYIKRKDLPHKNGTFYDYPDTMGNIYQRFFNKIYIPNFDWACGKWISVSRENIRKTPKTIYQEMLNFVLEDFQGKEPSQFIYRTRGIFIERLILSCFM